MSWDVFISKEEVKNLEDGNLPPIAEKTEFKNILNNLIPGIKYTEDDWAVFNDSDCSIEFNFGEDETVTHVMLYIRGGGDHPIAIIQSICDHCDCYAMDCATGEQMEFDESDQNSFKAWQDYRSKVIERSSLNYLPKSS